MKKGLFMLSGLLVFGTIGGCSQKILAQGQQFCALASATGPIVVALVQADGLPVVVTDKAKANVDAACAAWNAAAIVVSPPQGSVPTVAVALPVAPVKAP